MLLAERLHPQQLFPGDSEMARHMRALDWSQTALGAPASWPAHLRSALSLCLTSRIPVVMYWGADFSVLYNDAYISFLGPSKHPRLLGQPARECWSEIWPTIGPMLASVVETGVATWSEDVRMYFARRLPLEEVYVRFSFGPILAPDGRTVDGIFCPCTETTERVIAERQLETLRRLGVRAPQARTTASVCRDVCRVLEDNPADVPFVVLYLAEGEQALLADGCGLADATRQLPATVALDPAALKDALPAHLRGAPPVGQTLVLSIPGPSHDRPGGLLLAGTSRQRVFDENYRTFFEMAARHIGSALAEAAAYEAERKRAQALAELDRAKTVFFTNVSHEFRTPLTLMLGPLEDLLDQASDVPQADGQRQVLATAHRNAERLLKLVNTLLDFARIEGGRGDAVFEPTDLAALTADLASTFRSACERAGLRLRVDCKPLAEPVYVDREMWEKVVLNLLSNAFKFTLQGEIAVGLRARDGHAELQVHDSGAGIAAEELPKLFNRFERIAGKEGRSIEGSGIGLALSSELVKLHGGTIVAASEPGRGSVFTVRLPFGSAHLPARQVRLTARKAPACTVQARPFVVEALQWLPPAHDDHNEDSGFAALEMEAPRELNATAPRILVADDNADLRDYLRRLLGLRYRIELVPDGAAALESARRQPPDLIIADVMMPRLDGFGLLRELRADARTQTLPVILLSARAGEEARVEGLAAGADDYLSKPFSARELLARVAAHLAGARMRREAAAAVRESEELLRAALLAAGAGSWSFDPATERARWSPETYALLGIDPSIPATTAAGMPHIHPEDAAGLVALRDEQLARDGRIDLEYRLLHPTDGLRWHQARGRRIENGRVLGITLDITERKLAEQQAREADETLRIALDAGHAGAWVWRPETGELNYSPEARRLFGIDASLPEAELLRASLERVHPEDLQPMRDANRAYLRASGGLDAQYRIRHPVSGLRWLHHRGRRREGGSVVGILIDITERKLAEQAVRDNELRLSLAQQAARLGSWEIDPARGTIECTATHKALYGLEPDAPVSLELLYRMIHDDDREPVRAAVQKSVEEKTEFRIEYRVVWPDGSLHWLAGRGRTLYDADGRPPRRLGITLDITERKAVEEALHEERERLRIALKTAQLGSFQLELASGEMECSVQCKANFGLAPEEPLPYARLFELIHPEDRERVQATVRRAIETRTDYEAEYRTVWPRDGSVHWIMARGRALYADDGLPLRMLGVTQDVSERKHYEQALRESEARVRETLDAMPQIVYTAAPDGSISGFNRHAQLYTGKSEAAMLGDRWSAQVHPDDRERAVLGWAHAVESGQPFEIECRMRQADGEYRWLLTRALPIHREGRITRWVVTGTDIDDRKRYEGELTAVRNQLATQVADLTLLHEQTARLTSGRRMNAVLDELLQGALALTGASKGMLTLVDAQRGDLELVASAGLGDTFLALVQRIPKGAGLCGTCYQRGEHVIAEDTETDPRFELYREAARIGGFRSAHSTPLFARDGSVLGVLSLLGPEPGRRPGEREMRLVDLLARHAAGYIENLRLMDELQDADRRKDEFLATLAHELRNPLAPIRNSLHLLRMSGSRVSADRLHEMLDRQVNHMVRLVDDLMEVSRISRGKIDLRREPLDLASVVRTAVETSKPLIERGKHELAVVLPDEPLPVEGDAVRLAQVFANLLNNAAKYTDEGGHIEIAARRDGESALVAVRDSGIGIAPEQLPHLFEMFAQIDRGARAQGGLGIGLSLAQRLAQMHGGGIEAASEGLGRGARFTVRLPLAQHAVSPNGRAATAAAALQARRLLIIDDNRDAADSLGMVLGFLGSEVRVEHDGPAALAAIDSWQPQVVLLDLGMPGMDGFEVARRIRARQNGGALTLVALTGWGQHQDRERTRASGFDHHLVKPADIGALQALLASLESGQRK